MSAEKENIKYILPSHRIKILGTTILGLLLFLIFTISNLDKHFSMSDLILLPVILFLIYWFKRLFIKYSKVGFLINKLGLFDLNENLICKIEDITSIDASPYTFKSANGFIILVEKKVLSKQFQVCTGG